MFSKNYKKETKIFIFTLFVFSMFFSPIFPVGIAFASELVTECTNQTPTGSISADGKNATLVIPTGACPIKISFSSYTFQETIRPFDEQVLFDNITDTYGPGTHQIGPIDVACKWQSDIYGGDVQTELNPDYGHSNLIFSIFNENSGCNTPPVIALIGDNPDTVIVGGIFTDHGATAMDEEDGNITSDIITTGTVNTGIAGTYIITYSVTDSGGLSASTTRTVIVSSTTTPPVIPPVNPPTNNGGGGGGGNPGGHRRDISNLLATGGEILGATSCSYLRDYLKIDWQNDKIEVLKLQSFLNVFEKENLSLTGVFNQETFNAVQRFQIKYKGDILEPWGDKVTTGFVYILTKKKVNEIYCNTIYPLSQTDQNEIEAFKNSGKVGSSFDSGVLDSGVIFISDDITKESPVVELKDNSLSQSALKNIAVSLFVLPQKMFGNLFNNCSYTPTLLLLILIALIIIIIKLFINSKKNSQDISVATPITEVPTEKEPPVIILPGIVKEDEKIYTPEILPDEEIVIENPEEGPEEIIDDKIN